MADDNTYRSYRSNDPVYRDPRDGASHTDGSSDPLAELARLIGQPDPFADTAPAHAEPRYAEPRYDEPRYAEPRYQEPAAGDWRRFVQRPNFDAPDQPEYAGDPHYTDPYSDPYAAVSGPGGQAYAVDHGHYAAAERQGDDRYAEPADDRYGHHHPAGQERGYADERMFAAPPRAMAGNGRGGRADEGYDDPPRRRRGSSLVTAVVLICCAMLGTAGAYGYRTYSSHSGAKQPPVIIADSAPSKVVPADQKSARSQDRLNDQGGDERLVSREEQPVPLQTPGTSAVPRVVFPSPIPVPSTTGSTPAAGRQSGEGSNPNEQPKRIRTVTIRQDAGDGGGQPAADPGSRPAAGARPQARSATPSPAPAQRTSRDQPLSLDPAAPAADARSAQRPLTPPAPRETAAPAPREAPSQGTRLASAPSSGGGYLVQVSSQRSESDAQASYRGLQAKYSQLQARQPIIRRADLGSKGVYYRAMVGPFDTAGEAEQFCSGLKHAGGQCIILRN